MSEPSTFSFIPEQPSVFFTDNAANKVFELIEEEGNLNLNLRVSITGGGCSGFQYGFSFDENIQEDDFVVEKQLNNRNEKPNIKLLIDPISFQYLMGAEIDYTQDPSGEQFVIKNPNAKTTCGCGNSFSMD